MKALRKSYEHYGKAIGLFGLIYTLVAVGSQKLIENSLFAFWATYGAPLVILGGFVLWHVVRAPYENYCELWDAHVSDKEANTSQIRELDQRLEAEKSARQAAISNLEGRISFMRTPRFEIECGEHTTLQNGKCWYDVVHLPAGSQAKGT